MKASTLPRALIALLFLASCSTSVLKYEKVEELKQNQEFEQAVQIVPQNEVSVPVATPIPTPPTTPPSPVINKVTSLKVAPKKGPLKKMKAPVIEVAAPTPAPTPTLRQPEIEDRGGFEGDSRRPLNDPFRVGEEVVHDVHYFKVSAGALRFKVEPFSMVNNRKSYTFAMEIKTGALFSSFYSVDDRVETFVDYMDLVPRVFQLHVKESGQLREAKMLFNTDKNMATFWEKKVTRDHGEEIKKQEWEILPFTQNVYSAIFYMRNFQWDIGKEYAFRVANDKDNLIFSGKAIRREILDTKIGPMKAIVVQPNIVLKGKFTPIGDNFIWLSDDDRKYILRIESKIKIGTLISEVVSINPGKN